MTSAKRDQSIFLHINESFKNARIPLPKLRKLVQITCNRFRGDKTPDRKYEIHIAIVDDIQIRQLSGQFLHREETTDCLSFDLSDGDEEEPQAEKPTSSVFEIIVNGEMAARQANLRGHSIEAELALYITHGLLHHFGFDDATPGQARAMHDAEDEILQQIGYSCVYNRGIKAHEQ
jgi:probable rRNA maturation factor